MNIKLLIVLTAVGLVTACADKNNFEQAVLEHIKHEQQLQKEQHLKDYPIDPEDMAKCVVKLSSDNMPGFFPFDPARMTAYRNYAKMLNVAKSGDPKKTIEELRNDFGSGKALAEANSNISESTMDCLTQLTERIEGDVKMKEPE